MPAETASPSITAKFIAFLGLAQQLKVDFLPISWLPALDMVGLGAMGEIREAYMNAQVELAFKRLVSDVGAQSSATYLQPLMAELSILGHPSLRKHPNIMTLEGVCFEVKDKGDAWPVLVFRKSRNGDLARFMSHGDGKAMHFDDRLKLCADIAEAIMTMHSIGKINMQATTMSMIITDMT
jgi:serine/threonine protein kinase